MAFPKKPKGSQRTTAGRSTKGGDNVVELPRKPQIPKCSGCGFNAAKEGHAQGCPVAEEMIRKSAAGKPAAASEAKKPRGRPPKKKDETGAATEATAAPATKRGGRGRKALEVEASTNGSATPQSGFGGIDWKPESAEGVLDGTTHHPDPVKQFVYDEADIKRRMAASVDDLDQRKLEYAAKKSLAEEAKRVEMEAKRRVDEVEIVIQELARSWTHPANDLNLFSASVTE